MTRKINIFRDWKQEEFTRQNLRTMLISRVQLPLHHGKTLEILGPKQVQDPLAGVGEYSLRKRSATARAANFGP
jgi:ligand-binding SRPBCC domain-containing protein